MWNFSTKVFTKWLRSGIIVIVKRYTNNGQSIYPPEIMKKGWFDESKRLG